MSNKEFIFASPVEIKRVNKNNKLSPKLQRKQLVTNKTNRLSNVYTTLSTINDSESDYSSTVEFKDLVLLSHVVSSMGFICHYWLMLTVQLDDKPDIFTIHSKDINIKKNGDIIIAFNQSINISDIRTVTNATIKLINQEDKVLSESIILVNKLIHNQSICLSVHNKDNNYIGDLQVKYIKHMKIKEDFFDDAASECSEMTPYHSSNKIQINSIHLDNLIDKSQNAITSRSLINDINSEVKTNKTNNNYILLKLLLIVNLLLAVILSSSAYVFIIKNKQSNEYTEINDDTSFSYDNITLFNEFAADNDIYIVSTEISDTLNKEIEEEITYSLINSNHTDIDSNYYNEYPPSININSITTLKLGLFSDYVFINLIDLQSNNILTWKSGLFGGHLQFKPSNGKNIYDNHWIISTFNNKIRIQNKDSKCLYPKNRKDSKLFIKSVSCNEYDNDSGEWLINDMDNLIYKKIDNNYCFNEFKNKIYLENCNMIDTNIKIYIKTNILTNVGNELVIKSMIIESSM